jgi:UDP-N-acetylglucosamine 2-epimerase (non-hydrolysing)
MHANQKIMVVFGTRPETIKLAPVVKELQKWSNLQVVTVATAQHRGLMDQVLHFFGIKPDFDLDIMKPNQDLFYTTQACLSGLNIVLSEIKPSMLIVQGDTTTALAAALAGFYHKIPVAHVEAGLRTATKYSPFPEEMNRRLISHLTDLHFAPTLAAKANLLREGINTDSITVTGNTSIDALIWGCQKDLKGPIETDTSPFSKTILLTLHRRENFGAPVLNIFSAIRNFVQRHSDYQIIFPVHPNPNIKELADSMLRDIPNIILIDPVDYSQMLYLMKNSHFILTDSGGIQEEAPTLGKPVLVLRESTERPEAVEAGCAQLVGSHPELIFRMMEALADDNSGLYTQMSQKGNPFGNGTASKTIVHKIDHFLRHKEGEKNLCAELWDM